MKTAEEYTEKMHDTYTPYGWKHETHDDDCKFCHYEDEVIQAIQQARKEAIEETVRRCTDADPLESQAFYMVELELKKEIGL